MGKSEFEIVKKTGIGILLRDKEGYLFVTKKGYKFREFVKETPFIKKTRRKNLSGKYNYKILLINTGGTISSKIDLKEGGVSPEKIKTENIIFQDCLIKGYTPINILSGNLNYDDIKKVNDTIHTLYEQNPDVSGVLVTHGTDTLITHAAFAHYLLSDIKIPICFVGAQKSPDRPTTDRFVNFEGAIQFLKEGIPGVYVSTSGDSKNDNIVNINLGINVRKTHSSRRDAFRSPNNQPFARIKNNKIRIIGEQNYSVENIKLNLGENPIKIDVYYSHLFSEREKLIKKLKENDVVFVFGTGFGHIPETNSELPGNLRGIPIVATQCLSGSTNLKIYSYGRKMLKNGFIPNPVRNYEVCYAKTVIGLSNKLYKEELIKFLNKEIGGDIYAENL